MLFLMFSSFSVSCVWRVGDFVMNQERFKVPLMDLRDECRHDDAEPKPTPSQCLFGPKLNILTKTFKSFKEKAAHLYVCGAGRIKCFTAGCRRNTVVAVIWIQVAR